MNQQIKYSKKELSKLSEVDFEKLLNTKNMVIKNGEVIQVSDEEYKKVEQNYKDNENALRGDII